MSLFPEIPLLIECIPGHMHEIVVSLPCIDENHASIIPPASVCPSSLLSLPRYGITGGALTKRFNTPTRADPTTKTIKKAMIQGEGPGPSAFRSPAFPRGTFPRLSTLPSNLSLRFRTLRGRACSYSLPNGITKKGITKKRKR